nr:EOG090X0DDP [Polyphemus pediculus]
MGVLPPRPWNEKPIFLSATGGVFEAYVPPEGDGKVSVLSKEGAKQSLEFFSKKSKSMLAVRKIRSFDEDFDPKEFSEVAQQLYIKAHKALAEKDHDTLHECVTELAFPLMTNDIRFCTVRWNFIKSLEPPRVVHVRCTDVVSKDNVFAQSMLAVRKIRSFDEDFDPKEFSEVAQQLYIKAHKALAEKDHDTLHEKIRSFDEDFDPKEFSEVAQQLYIKAHKALAEKDHDTLHECVTELAFPLMTNDIRFCTVRWNFIKSLEPPRVVHVRCTDVVSKDNVFAQVTTRFHTQQTLAVYDRFGRLMFGNEVVAKDVLEYVVFEKHVANQYGSWRIHEKIIPDWMPPRDSGLKTFIQQAQEISAASETGLVSTKEKTVTRNRLWQFTIVLVA